MKHPIPLYTGGGVSLSPINAEGRKLSAYVRLVAEDGMAITNGKTVTTCADVLATDVPNWKNCEAPTEEADEVSAEEALAELVEVLA